MSAVRTSRVRRSIEGSNVYIAGSYLPVHSHGYSCNTVIASETDRTSKRSITAEAAAELLLLAWSALSLGTLQLSKSVPEERRQHQRSPSA